MAPSEGAIDSYEPIAENGGEVVGVGVISETGVGSAVGVARTGVGTGNEEVGISVGAVLLGGLDSSTVGALVADSTGAMVETVVGVNVVGFPVGAEVVRSGLIDGADDTEGAPVAAILKDADGTQLAELVLGEVLGSKIGELLGIVEGMLV